MKKLRRPNPGRLSRAERYEQLLETARSILKEEGTDALTLAKLAERADVSKPVVYDHFESRGALLAALFQDYDARRSALMDSALRDQGFTFSDRARIVATAYIDCVVEEAREVPGVAFALAGSAEMEELKRVYQDNFIAKCRSALTDFEGGISVSSAALWAMLGAADALVQAKARGAISYDEAVFALYRIIISPTIIADPQ